MAPVRLAAQANIHRASEQLVGVIRNLTGYTFTPGPGGFWGALVVSYDLRLADLLEEVIAAARAGHRWSCQLLLRSIADTWLYGRYLIRAEAALDRMMVGWNRHVDAILAANNRREGPPPKREGERPPPEQVAELLDTLEPPMSQVLAAKHAYALVWEVKNDWAAHGGLSAVRHYPVFGDDEIALRESVPSDFDTGTSSTVALQLVADFTRRTSDALELTDVPPGGDAVFGRGVRGRRRRA